MWAQPTGCPLNHKCLSHSGHVLDVANDIQAKGTKFPQNLDYILSIMRKSHDQWLCTGCDSVSVGRILWENVRTCPQGGQAWLGSPVHFVGMQLNIGQREKGKYN